MGQNIFLSTFSYYSHMIYADMCPDTFCRKLFNHTFQSDSFFSHSADLVLTTSLPYNICFGVFNADDFAFLGQTPPPPPRPTMMKRNVFQIFKLGQKYWSNLLLFFISYVVKGVTKLPVNVSSPLTLQPRRFQSNKLNIRMLVPEELNWIFWTS